MPGVSPFQQTAALVVFGLCYLLFALRTERKALFAAAGAAAVLALRLISPKEALAAVDWNVLGIFAGTMILAEAFSASGAPAVIVEALARRARSAGAAALWVCALCSALSAVVENVAAVLVVAPLAVELSRRSRIPLGTFLAALAMTSNLQGSATLIGDPPSMILASHMRLSFGDFFWVAGRPGPFFAVQAGAAASLCYLWTVFRRWRGPVEVPEPTPVDDWFPTWLLCGLVVALSVSGALGGREATQLAGLICLAFGTGAGARRILRSGRPAIAALRRHDWTTPVFLAGAFVLVGTLEQAGWLVRAGRGLSALTGGSKAAAFLAVVAASVAASAVVDNVPYVIAALPVATGLAAHAGWKPELLAFGLLIGATVGGNITPIGAAANIAACGIARAEGERVTFGAFARVGLPFTIAATAASALFLWLFWR